jgi:hypothetical protein
MVVNAWYFVLKFVDFGRIENKVLFWTTASSFALAFLLL